LRTRISIRPTHTPPHNRLRARFLLRTGMISAKIEAFARRAERGCARGIKERQ